MTATVKHIVIRDHLPRVRELAAQRARRQRRDQFFRPVREGFLDAWRMFWSLLRNPAVWTLVFAYLLWASFTGAI